MSLGFRELCGLLAAITWAIGSLFFSKIGARMSSGAMSLGKTASAGLMLGAEVCDQLRCLPYQNETLWFGAQEHW